MAERILALVAVTVVSLQAWWHRAPANFDPHRAPTSVGASRVERGAPGRVTVLDFSVEEKVTTHKFLGRPNLMAWGCISFVVANRSRRTIYVLDGEGPLDGLRTDLSDLDEHRAEFRWTLHNSRVSGGLHSCHGHHHAKLVAIPSGAGLQFGQCVPLTAMRQDYSRQTPYRLDAIDQFDLVVAWADEPVEPQPTHTCACNAACNNRVREHLTHSARTALKW
jgi:hypothetical protein